jgi:ADP-heptose:LPS heptosyltransferase
MLFEILYKNMEDKRNKHILDKIAKALRKRQNRGLTVQQLNDAAKKVSPQPKSNKVEMGNIRKKIERDKTGRPLKAVYSSTIFLSGSIGDIFALESFFTDNERDTINGIYYATQKSAAIETTFKALPNYPALKRHEVAWNDFSNFWCFYSKDECIHRFSLNQKTIPSGLKYSADFSIGNKFDEIHAGIRRYNGSSFVKHNVANISKFNLPNNYIVICPYSTDKRIKDRDFTNKDWTKCLDYLKTIGMRGVVINIGNDPIPQSETLINLTNKTTIVEAIEVVKCAKGYIGIDSCMSVLAAKLFTYPRLLIKSVNPHCYQHAKIYYAPQISFGFLVNAIDVPENINAPLVKPKDPSSKRSITLNVCQGVGDIFWVYQKFAPHFDEINFCISQIPDGVIKLQTRAVDFLRLLPKVNDVTSQIVSSDQYLHIANGRWSMKQIIDDYNNKGIKKFDYACNNHLENGIRLEEIDPEYEIEETVDMKSQYLPMPCQQKKYLTVYVSGGTLVPEVAKYNHLWDLPKWKNFIQRFCDKYNLDMPIVLIGASYDQQAVTQLSDMLKQTGMKTYSYIDALASNVAYILKNSFAYIGYQSGLNIIADNYDVKQAMMYFPSLRSMMYAWCKKRNKENGIFYADTFDKSPDKVIDDMVLDLPKTQQ